MNKNKLTLGSDKMICGVCSGIAEYMDCDVSILRLIWGVFMIYWPAFLILYFVSWLIIPSKNEYTK